MSPSQALTADDDLAKLLRELPEPNEATLKNMGSVVKLDLIQTREHLGLSPDPLTVIGEPV